jgi:hypothetical protein
MGIPKMMALKYLECLLVCWSFLPWEKTIPQNSFPLLFCGCDISGHKDKMQVSINPSNKICFEMSRE